MSLSEYVFMFIVIVMAATCIGNPEPNFWTSISNTIFGKASDTSGSNNEVIRLDPVNEYWLYTRVNPTAGQRLFNNDTRSVSLSNLDKSKVTVFLVHGWIGYYTDDFNVNVTAALLKNSDVNVICVDWSIYSKKNYITSANSVHQIGNDLGDFILWMINLGFSYDKVHIAGHSLGSHVAGYAGKRCGGKIGRITGLDPAGPLWSNRDGLTKNDAKYVECIHTCARILGTTQPLGHADFYPNGGAMMPGCGIDISCSHVKAIYYYSATIAFPDKLVGKECATVNDALNCKCNGKVAVMGNNDVKKNLSGLYCLKTKNDYPYF